MHFPAREDQEYTQKDRLKGRKLIIPVFVPHMGCPHDCCFCNQRTISGRQAPPTEQLVAETVQSYEKIAAHYGSVEVAFYGGSFTAIPVWQQERYLRAARSVCGYDFRVSTRPDAVDGPGLKLLKQYGVKTVELGAQSMCDPVLKCSGRGHLAEDTRRAAAFIKQEGFTLGIQTMLGLPASDRERERHTAREVIALKPDLVRIYPTIVLRDTALAAAYQAGDYKPMELSEAVALCADLVQEYERSGICVIRLGLQFTDQISSSGCIVAGPYHPAFGELVRSQIALCWVCSALEEMRKDSCLEKCLSFDGYRVRIWTDEDRLVLDVPKKYISRFVGQHRCNIILGEQYGFTKVKVAAGDL